MKRVLILGVPRSGTTWIGSALGHCAGATYVHEPDGVHEPFAYRAKSTLPDGFILGPGRSALEYERLWSGAFAGGAKTANLRDHLSRRLYGRVSTSQRAHARAGGRPAIGLQVSTALALPRIGVAGLDAVVVKSVDAALSAEWIAAQFAPKVIVVTRDIRSVLASWLSLEMRGPQEPGYRAITSYAQQRWGVELPPFEAPLFERMATVCSVWALALRSAAAAHHGWLSLRYEDVVESDPVDVLRRIAGAAGLTWGQAATDYVTASNQPGEGYSTRRLAGTTTDSWRTTLQSGQLAAIDMALERFPESLG